MGGTPRNPPLPSGPGCNPKKSNVLTGVEERELEYHELLKIRIEVGKILKAVSGPPPIETMFSTNLAATLVHATSSVIHLLDAQIVAYLEYKAEVTEDHLRQETLAAVPVDEVMSVDQMKSAINTFLGPVATSGVSDSPPAGVADADPETVRNLLAKAQPKRELPPIEVFARWQQEGLLLAETWARRKLGGVDAPPPDVVAQEQLEDLDLDNLTDRLTLLRWVGIEVVEDVEWDGEKWNQIIEWAMPAHRIDRGETGLRVPELPDHFYPAPSVFGSIKRLVHTGGQTIATIGESVEGHGITMAVQALLAAGEITGTPGHGLESATAELVESEDELYRIFGNIASRRISVGLTAEGDLVHADMAEEPADSDSGAGGG